MRLRARTAAGSLMFEGMSAAERRRFLHAGGQLAASLLAMGVPSDAGPPPSSAVLDLVEGDIAALRAANVRVGSAAVIGPAIRTADHLVRMLAGIGEASPHRPRAARLACDAAHLTGWCSHGQGDERAALEWFKVASRAAQAAGDTDRMALMALREGWALYLLDNQAAALRTFAGAAPLLPRVTPTTRGYVEFHRADVLALSGHERTAWRMFDKAAMAFGRAQRGEQPWLWWVRTDDRAIKQWSGRIELGVGYGDAAYGHLALGLPERTAKLPFEAGADDARRRG